MLSLGTPRKPFNFPQTSTCLNFIHHAILFIQAGWKTNGDVPLPYVRTFLRCNLLFFYQSDCFILG